jgi:hypothetical protein
MRTGSSALFSLLSPIILKITNKGSIKSSCCWSLILWRRGHKDAINVSTKKVVLSKEELEKRQKELMAKNLPKRKPILGVKRVVLISSGKGGVGKSTIAGIFILSIIHD